MAVDCTYFDKGDNWQYEIYPNGELTISFTEEV